jgi:4,5-DOPA dioxygenase extradiol
MPALPTLFLAHGHPMNALEDNVYTRSWQQLADGIATPEAVLCVSAHWETPGIQLTADAHPSTVHDFYGFPPALYAQQYACPGAPALAKAIAQSLPSATLVTGRGLDHGAWCVLNKLYPAANIPVIQMSLAMGQTAAWHFQIGQCLQPWRKRGLLIIGSGNIVHNIRRWMSASNDITWATSFDRWVMARLTHNKLPELTNYTRAPFTREAVPTPEHYWPLLYAAGAHVNEEPIVQTAFTPNNLGNACMRSIRFGDI